MMFELNAAFLCAGKDSLSMMQVVASTLDELFESFVVSDVFELLLDFKELVKMESLIF
jgi:hypothetical protein